MCPRKLAPEPWLSNSFDHYWIFSVNLLVRQRSRTESQRNVSAITPWNVFAYIHRQVIVQAPGYGSCVTPIGRWRASGKSSAVIGEFWKTSSHDTRTCQTEVMKLLSAFATRLQSLLWQKRMWPNNMVPRSVRLCAVFRCICRSMFYVRRYAWGWLRIPAHLTPLPPHPPPTFTPTCLVAF